jgi:hypothetical protein
MASPQQTSAPNSPDDSTYGTRADESSTMKPNEKDAQLVVGAGRSLKNMLVDLMGVLEGQANTKIFIQGDITLRVDGRAAYTIKLRNEDNVEPSNLKVRIDNAPADNTAADNAPIDTDGNGSTSEKRKSSQLEDNEDESESASKRVKTAEQPAQPHTDEETAGEQDATDIERIMTKFSNVSAQIKWVEECRRLAGQSHDAREEKWRSTSATFHDDNRKASERHNMWLTAEMGWQRNMLIQLANDVKGLYPLAHSMKWETPPTMNHSAPPIPMPIPRDRPLGKAYVPKPKKLAPPPSSNGSKP